MNDSISMIQCYMLSVGVIGKEQFGIGFPVDMPVMLTYFEGNELKPVQPDYPDYEHLIHHVEVQMDSNGLQLHNTPIVLTLQGEFEDESLNQIYPGPSLETSHRGGGGGKGQQGSKEEEWLDFDDEDREEITIADVLKLEGISDLDSDDFDDDDDDDEEEEEDEEEEDDIKAEEMDDEEDEEDEEEEEESDDEDVDLPGTL